MNKLYAILAILAFGLAAGCHAQVPPTPPVYSCPAAPAGGTAYAPLNAPANNTVNSAITGTATTDTPGPGTWCYIVQTWAIVPPATVYQDSGPSNVAQITLTASGTVNLSWQAPSNVATYSSTGYVVSRSPAVAVAAPLAPTESTPTTTALLDQQKQQQMAAVVPAPANLEVARVASR